MEGTLKKFIGYLGIGYVLVRTKVGWIFGTFGTSI